MQIFLDVLIILGNPGRIVRYRFSGERIAELLASKWWEKDVEDLADRIDEFKMSTDDTTAR